MKKPPVKSLNGIEESLARTREQTKPGNIMTTQQLKEVQKKMRRSAAVWG